MTELAVPATPKSQTAFGCPREFLGNRFVYVVVSSRARGLSIGVNMRPDRQCNFDCPYCEVNRSSPSVESSLDLEVLADELRRTLEIVRSGEIKTYSFFHAIPDELLELRHVALSGDGEPTLCPNFSEVVQTVAHVRAVRAAYFKIVLITNATGLHLPEVQDGLQYLKTDDEIWAKLDAGTQAYMDQINRGLVSLDAVLGNILNLARRRPVIIQSLFASINGQEAPTAEIKAYAENLRSLKEKGAKISLVQVYSATRPMSQLAIGHLPLRNLSRIANVVREISGLKAEVF